MKQFAGILCISLCTHMGAIQMEEIGDTQVKIGLNKDQRAQISDSLNKLLANEYLLYTKTLHSH